MWNRQLLRTGTLAIVAVSLLGLCLAAGAAWWWQTQIDEDAEVGFQRSVERVMVEVTRRFRQPVYGLNGAKGLYGVSKHVQRDAFRAYVESRDLPTEFPGVRGFGFIQHVMRPELDAFVAAERADGAPEFAIRQLADKNHDDLYVIKFIEPAASNAGAQGLDIGSEANRRAAAQRAIDTGEPTITAAITLVQDQRKTPGVLLFVPVYAHGSYAHGSHPSTADERRAALVGLLYAPIVIAELLDGMADVGAGHIDFELFDTAPGTPGGTLLYDADRHLANPSATQDAVKGRRFSVTMPLSLSVGDLTLQASSSAGFDAAINQSSKWLVFAAGTLLSALLALLLRQQATGRRRAELLAQQMTEQLRQDEERSRDFSKSASDWFWETDAQHNFCFFSDNFEKVYGLPTALLIGKSRKALLDRDGLNPREVIEAHLAQLDAHLPFKNFEYQVRVKDGALVWISVSGIPHADAEGCFAGYRGTGTLITQRKEFECQLQQQNHTLSALFENFPGGISLFNADLRLVAHNAQLRQLLNLPDALFEKPVVYFEDIIRYNAQHGEYGPGDPDKQVAAIVARARNFQPHKMERVRPDGTVLEERGVPLPEGGFVSIYTDITERKRSEEEVSNQRRRLSDIIEGTHVGTWEWNVQTGATVFNERWAEIIGYTLDELAPVSIDTWMKFSHPDDLKLSGDLLEKHFAGELDYYKCDSRMRHKDGHWVWVQDRGKVANWTAEGKPLLMSGTHQDITERKDAEARLLEAEALLRSAIETIGEAFVVFDAEDRLVFCNEEYRELYYLSAPAIVPGRSFEEIIRYGVERGQYKGAIGREEAWIAERMAAHRKGNQDLIQQLDDGRWLKITERHTPSGHIVGFRVDVTEFYRARQAAEAASSAKSRFLATMSHEIRTPMNGILGMAQMLLMPSIEDDERQDYARVILNSGQTLLALLNDILDISKVEAGKLELESAAIDPAQIIHEIRTLFGETARHKGLCIESEWLGATDQPGQPGQRYLGDPHRLRQMLSNLVGNALKFTAQGHIRIEAREVERDGPHALLEFKVTDTGIGVAEEKQALLFKPFSQADSSTTREYGGTGLGLSLVRSMAKLMGGDVGIDSEAGHGSCFWFRIRADLLAPGADSRDEKREAIVGAGDTAMGVRPSRFNGHILVVDDNPTNRMVLKAMLNKPGVHCDFVEDGRQAVEAITGADRIAPDLVLMDCQMPVLDGYQATLQIRRWEAEHARPRLPIVALTASAFEDDRKHCLDVGMDDFLAKPIEIEKLMATLGHWLASGSDMEGAADVGEATPAAQAAITPQESGPQMFDAQTLVSQLGGDRDLAKAVILSAMEDIPRYFEQLEHAIAASNWKVAERQTHTLKGLTAQIGGIKLAVRMKVLDDHLKGGGDTNSDTVADLRREYQTLSAALLEWIR